MRIDGPLDGRLHLLDRQVVDCDGLMVCKVDEVELTVDPEGVLAVTALLVGTAALLPRLDGRNGNVLLRLWADMGSAQAARRIPFRIELARVASLGSDVRLDVPRDQLLRQPRDEALTARRRLGDLLDADVVGPDGTALGRVLDVRLEPEHLPQPRLRVVALVVGRGRPGTMLGYDRGGNQGPWLVAKAVRALHRHSGLAPYDAVDGVDWNRRELTLNRPLERLAAPR